MSRNTITLFYGPKQVTDAAVLNKIASAIDHHQDFTVDNEALGGDPAVGTRKFAVIYYRLQEQNSPLRGRSAAEGEKLTFGTDIELITYGGKQIADPLVYNGCYTAFTQNHTYHIDNNSMGGDPAVGTVKTATAIYYKNGGTPVQESRKENEDFKWDAHN